MRELSFAELELVSGGNNTWPPHELDEIVVTHPGYDHDWSYDTEYDGYVPGGGGSGLPTANETDCVSTTLASGADLQQVNNHALAGGNEIAALRDHAYEYSVIVWSLNGVVGHTTPHTDRNAGLVNWLGNLDEVPTGAVIVGIVHNHPNLPGINDTIPSYHDGGDWDQRDRLVEATLQRGITVDPNVLLYIQSNEDNKTRVYDKNDRDTRTRECAL